MQISICHYFLFAAVLAMAKCSVDYSCEHRHCYVSTNEQNERIMNCTLGKAQQDLVACFYNSKDRQMIITTIDQSFVKVDRIAPDAFKRITSGIMVSKFFFNNIQVGSLDSNDFNGLKEISEVRIENPKSLAFNTFMSMQAKRTIFILTITCSQGNTGNSFNELYMNTRRWKLFSNGCNKTRICEFSSCTKDEPRITRIIATNQTSIRNYQLNRQSCKESLACSSKDTSVNPIRKTTIPLFTTSTLPSKSAKYQFVSSSASNSSYDTLMWIVLVLTGINSIVILGILLFLIVWWKKFTNTAANKKHTIILEDGEDTKYLKLSPYA